MEHSRIVGSEPAVAEGGVTYVPLMRVESSRGDCLARAAPPTGDSEENGSAGQLGSRWLASVRAPRRVRLEQWRPALHPGAARLVSEAPGRTPSIGVAASGGGRW